MFGKTHDKWHEITELKLFIDDIIPEELSQLYNLTRLEISSNLSEFPALVQQLEKRESLKIFANRNLNHIAGLPETIQYLDLQNNGSYHIPVEVLQLPVLRALDLYQENNQLETFLIEIFALRHLPEINLHENPLLKQTRDFLDFISTVQDCLILYEE